MRSPQMCFRIDRYSVSELIDLTTEQVVRNIAQCDVRFGLLNCMFCASPGIVLIYIIIDTGTRVPLRPAADVAADVAAVASSERMVVFVWGAWVCRKRWDYVWRSASATRAESGERSCERRDIRAQGGAAHMQGDVKWDPCGTRKPGTGY